MRSSIVKRTLTGLASVMVALPLTMVGVGAAHAAEPLDTVGYMTSTLSERLEGFKDSNNDIWYCAIQDGKYGPHDGATYDRSKITTVSQLPPGQYFNTSGGTTKLTLTVDDTRRAAYILWAFGNINDDDSVASTKSSLYSAVKAWAANRIHNVPSRYTAKREQYYERAWRYQQPMTLTPSVSVDKDKMGMTVGNIGVKATSTNGKYHYVYPGEPNNATHTPAVYTLTINGPGLWDSTKSKTLTLPYKDSFQSAHLTATGVGDVSVSVHASQIPPTTLRYWPSEKSGMQGLMSYGQPTTLSATVNAKLWGDMEMNVTSKVSSHSVKKNDTVVDTFTVKPGEGDIWLNSEKFNGYYPVKMNVAMYYMGTEKPAQQNEIPADAVKLHDEDFTLTPKNETEATKGVTLDVKNWHQYAKRPDKPKVVEGKDRDFTGFYTFVATIDPKAQQHPTSIVDHEYIRGGKRNTPYGEPSETIVRPWQPQITSNLEVMDTREGKAFQDRVQVKGFPTTHSAWSGAEAPFGADVKTFDTYLFCVDPAKLDKPGATKGLEPLGKFSLPAKNGVYEIREDADGTPFTAENFPCDGAYQLVSAFTGDARASEHITGDTDAWERFVPKKPSLHTTATDQADGDKELEADKPAVVNDKVCYTNLTVGKEYELKPTLMDKATGKPVADQKAPIKKFTPTKAKDCVDVSIEIPGKVVTAGSTFVVFENLYRDKKEIAVHADINDEGQTVRVPPPPQLAKTGVPAASLLLIALAMIGAGASVYRYRKAVM